MGRDLEDNEDHDELRAEQPPAVGPDGGVDPKVTNGEERPSARERWLKLALLAIAAGLAASIVSLISQRLDDDDPADETDTTRDSGDEEGGAAESAPASSGDGPRSGTVTIDIDAFTDRGGRAADVVTRFNGGDFATTIAFIDDPDTYSGTPETEELRSVGGTYYHRATADGDWQPADDPSVVSLDEGIALPSVVLGWTTNGIDELLTAAGITPDADGEAAAGTITVGQARSLDSLPAGIAVIVADEWDWADDQPITVRASFDAGTIVELDAEASDDGSDRPSGPVTVTASTAYTELDGGQPIDAPS